MPRLVDNLLAFRILYMLVTPFVDTDAYKLGIIDDKGNNLIKSSTFTSGEQKDSYTALHRLVFKLKGLLAKLPGGDNRLKSIVAAYWLIKEHYESGRTTLATLEEEFMDILERSENIDLIEEEITVTHFLEALNEDGVAGAPTNATGPGVSTDMPAIRKKRKFQAFTVNDDVFNKFKSGKAKYRKWGNYLNLEDEGQKMIYDWARKNPKGIIVLHNGKNTKAIRYNRRGGGNWSKIGRPVKQINNEII